MREVSSLGDYQAVVLRSAVYMGRWRAEAGRFVRQHNAELAKSRVWLFESGWMGEKPKAPAATSGGLKRALHIVFPRPLSSVVVLIRVRATGLVGRILAKRRSGDFRNWDDIRAWAANVADVLAAAQHR